MNNNTNTSNLPQTTTTTPTKQSIPIRNTPTNGTNTPIPTKGTITSTETEPKTTKNTSIDEKVVLSSSTKLVSSDTDTVLLQNRYHPTDNIKNSTMSDDGHDATVDELPSSPKSSNTTTSIHNYNNKSNNCNYVVVVRSLTVSCIGYLYQWLVIAPVNIFGYIVGNQHIPTDSQQQQQQQQQQSNGITNTITTSIVSKRNSATTTSSLQPESKSQPKINEGKYIPPQLRGGGGSGGGGKYIPPQRRKQMEAELQQKQQQNQPQDSVVVVTAAIQNPHSASSIHQHHPPSKRLGGCADPTLIRGSICDEMYIPKKASEVGSKVHSESFGSLGGLPSSSRHRGSENGTKQITNDNNTNNNIQWEVGAVSKCGLRSSNEDSYIVVNDLLGSSSSSSSSSSVNEEQSQQPTISATRKKEDDESSSLSASDDINSSFFKSHQSHGIFAIFDGHCGNQTARFAAEKFPSILLDESRNDDFLTTITATNKTEAGGTTDGGGQSLAAANNNSNTIEEANVCTLLQNTVARLDHEFCRISMADGRQWDCGATALIAIVIEDTLVVAGLGDSNGVICCAISPDDSDDGGGGDVVGEEDGWTILKEEGRDEPTKTNNAYSSSLGDNDDSKQQNHVHPRGVTVILKEVVNPHNPSREDERTRIENANGWVVTDPEQISRVCGDLAVSRSLGDREFKAAYNMSMAQQNSSYNGVRKNPNSFTGAILQDNTIAHKWGSEHLSEEYRLFPTPEKGHHFIGDVISAVPEINSFQLGRRRTNRVIEEFLLLACDGLWDVMSVVDVTRLTRKLLFRKGLTAEASADYLVEHAFSLGSRDNVTVIIVRFYGNDSTSR